MKALCAIFLLTLCACKETPKSESPPSEKPAPSQEKTLIQSVTLKGEFPLLPLLEPTRWQKLLAAEGSLRTAINPEQRQQAAENIKKISAELQRCHPFNNSKTSTTLGGITYHKDAGKITIPAIVDYPPAGDKRHPQELELILCSQIGRTHETLFTTLANPLHLEVILHLAGYKKLPDTSSKFHLQITIPSQPKLPAIPIRYLLQTTAHQALPDNPLVWEFSGSDITRNLYSPEQTGDLIICWHVHDSVLRITDPQIASGETKILPVKHPKLTPKLPIEITLTPVRP